MASNNSISQLSEEDFLEVVKNTKLVSIDLIIKNDKGKILMGWRKNEPSKNKWFVPGGRIYKGEFIHQALERILFGELGDAAIRVFNAGGRFILPLYDHIYETNFFGVEGVSTEYIVLPYYIEVEENIIDISAIDLDSSQHEKWKWVDVYDLKDVHVNSQAYFETAICGKSEYEILNHRRDSFNQLLWETPSISLVAQSFLLTTIFNPDVPDFARKSISLLALVSAIASVQLLAKHRFNESFLAKQLEEIEKSHSRYQANKYITPKNKLTALSSYKIWFCMLFLFGFTAFLVLVRPSLFGY